MPLPTSGGMADYIKNLQNELSQMLPKQAPPPRGWRGALEGALTGAAAVGEGSPTIGGNIANVANALLQVPQLMQQRRVAQQMQSLQGLEPYLKLREAYGNEQKQQSDAAYQQAQIANMQANASHQAWMEENYLKPQAASYGRDALPRPNWQPIEQAMHIGKDGKLYIPRVDQTTGRTQSTAIPFSGSLLKPPATPGGAPNPYKDMVRADDILADPTSTPEDIAYANRLKTRANNWVINNPINRAVGTFQGIGNVSEGVEKAWAPYISELKQQMAALGYNENMGPIDNFIAQVFDPAAKQKLIELRDKSKAIGAAMQQNLGPDKALPVAPQRPDPAAAFKSIVDQINSMGGAR